MTICVLSSSCLLNSTSYRVVLKMAKWHTYFDNTDLDDWSILGFHQAWIHGVSAAKRDQIENFMKNFFISEIDINLII